MVGSRRVVRTLPGWRSAAMRLGALIPSQAGPAMKAFELQGSRRTR
jgi:hypothetical protein